MLEEDKALHHVMQQCEPDRFRFLSAQRWAAGECTQDSTGGIIHTISGQSLFLQPFVSNLHY